MISQICSAIQNMNVLTFTYDGFERIVEPHAYGNDIKGNDAVRVFQIGGDSESGEVVAWKLFLTSKMQNLQVQDQKFSSPRPGYRQGDKAMRKIYCQL